MENIDNIALKLDKIINLIEEQNILLRTQLSAQEKPKEQEEQHSVYEERGIQFI